MLWIFYLSMAVLLWTVYRIQKMHKLVLRHRSDLAKWVGETLADLPPELAEPRFKQAQAILDAQLAEVEALRRRWWR